MPANLEIVSPGIMASVQDQGRSGYGSDGVPSSGAIDPVMLRLGNALVGNSPFEAAIEFRFLGPQVRADGGAVRLGLAAHAGAELMVAATQERRSISPWQTVTLHDGDTLKVSPLQEGATGYLTILGGLDLEPILGSRSTYARARLGGLNGDLLRPGARLPLKQAAAQGTVEKIMERPLLNSCSTLHVLPGPQDDHFSAEEMAAFFAAPYEVSADVDRMGIRLEGRRLTALPDKGYDLISDGLVPGAIQVPGSGQPIILSVDCQTVGGYPKIATVISADQHLLGQLAPGQQIRFKRVDLAAARTQYGQLERSIASALESIRPYFGEGALDLTALYQSNLVGGVVDAQNPGHITDHLED